MFKKIKSFVFCLLPIICTGLNVNAMNEFQTPHTHSNCGYGDESTCKRKQGFRINTEAPFNYLVLHLNDYGCSVSDTSLDRESNKHCSRCRGEFNYDFYFKDGCETGEVVFIPLSKSEEIDSIWNLCSDSSKDKLCYNCMHEFLQICRKHNAQFHPEEIRYCNCAHLYFDLDDLGWVKSIKNLGRLFKTFS